MTTWAGAIVETGGRADFATVAAQHRITVTGAGEAAPWVLVQAGVSFGSRHPLAFAENLSRDLASTVIAFLVQTTASVEQVEHWKQGQLLRKLAYAGDGGAWIAQEGSPQAWEPRYFFADDESTAEGARWPLNLGDELTDDELVRYERARIAKDASGILDLLSGGSTSGLQRLCAHFGVDPNRPGGRYAPPVNWRPRLVVAAIVAALGGAIVLGAIAGHR